MNAARADRSGAPAMAPASRCVLVAHEAEVP
jgi:hypothetical protein